MGDFNNLNEDLNPVYYTAPIELWRNFLDKPSKVLDDVLAYVSAGYDAEQVAASKLNVDYSNWSKVYKRGEELRSGNYCGINFSISQRLYLDYRENKKTEYDNLLLLAYLALNSMRGNFTFTNSTIWFCRMAGYKDIESLEASMEKQGSKKNKNKKTILPLPMKLAKYATSKRTFCRKCERLRLDLMRKFKHVHFYTEQGKRDFGFMFDTKRPRQECMNELAKLMHQRGKTAQRDELKEMIKKAKNNTSN